MKNWTCSFLGVAALLAPSIAQANLVSNGSFESFGGSGFNSNIGAGLTNWSISGGGVDIVTQSTWQPAAGVASITLGWTAPATISQTVTTASGQAYDLSFFMAAEIFGGSALRTMDVLWNGNVVSSPSFAYTGQGATSMGWTQNNLTVIGTGSDLLQFRSTTLSLAQYGPALDNVQLNPVLNLTGTLVLGDTSAAFAFSRNIGYSVKQGTTTVASGTITANATSTPLSISVPATVTGASQLVLDGSSFLKRVININLTGSNLAIGSATMQNGDVDNSGEVDAADIDAVIADFGDTTNNPSDVDVSGEVDAADIDIVIANFGGVDQ